MKEKESGTNLKRRRRNTLNHIQPSVIRVRRSTRGRGVLLHLLPRCLLLFIQIFSSPRRCPAKKKSRIASRSSPSAGVNSQSASRAASPVSHRDHLSLYADSNDELYSHSEDAQDSAPDNTNPVPENQSEISQEDFGFSGLIEEVFKLLLSDMFPRKTEQLLGGNRPRSSIELEVGKATKKNCSLPQSRRPLMQAVQGLNESLGASAVDGTFPMPSSITQDWVPSRADIKKQVKFKCYQSHNEFIPTENASALDPDAARLGMSLLETPVRRTGGHYL